MKLLVLVLALLIPTTSHAADDAVLARARYAAVDKIVPQATVVKRELQGYSLEGGELTAYFQKGAPLKMIAKHYGESGKTTDELYFWQGRLFSVLRTSWQYDMKFSPTEAPNLLREKKQNRYYFENGELTRWINENGNLIESGGEFKTRQKERLSFARAMLAGTRAKSKTIVAR